MDGLEFAAVDRDDRVREQVQLLAHDDELSTDFTNHLAVIFSEVRYRLEVWRQATGQPHQLDVTLRFTLESLARLNRPESPRI